MTTSALYPTIKPSLSLDFANTKQLDPRVTFTRSSTAAYYDGKSVTKSEENLTISSEDATGAGWTPVSVVVTSNNIAAPNGANTGDMIRASGTDIAARLYHQFLCNGSVPYTVSIYVKAGTSRYFWLTPRNPSVQNAFFGAFFDVYDGVVLKTYYGASASLLNYSITLAENGWYRVSVTGTVSSGGTLQLLMGIGYSSNDTYDSGGSFSNPYTFAGTETVYLWGLQAEQRATLTPYVATTNLPITNYIPSLTTAAVGTPRFDHDHITKSSKGLFMEVQRTNLLMDTQRFSIWPKQAATGMMAAVDNDVTIAPDGTKTASRLYAKVGNSGYFNVYYGASFLANQPYTLSVFAKTAEYDSVQLTFVTSGGGNGLWFNTTTGAETNRWKDDPALTINSVNIIPVGNGWYRYCVTVTSTAASPSAQVKIELGNATNVLNKGVYIWGAQLELSEFPTSYIPTPLTAVSRNTLGTYQAADGIIRTAEPGVPRYNANANGGSTLLIEAATTNNTDASNYLARGTFGYLNESSAYDSVMAAPDGSLSAGLLAATQVNGRHSTYYNGIAKNTFVTMSVYLKPGPSTVANLDILCRTNTNEYTYRSYTNLTLTGNGSLTPVVNVGVDGSTPSGYAFIENVGGGWYRCSITFRTYNGANALNAVIAEIRPNYGQATGGMYIWGRQLELSANATSYVPSIDTFTGRSGVATYYDSTGVLRTALSGQARYSYNPANLSAPPKLLLEAAATNHLLNSTALFGSGINATFSSGAGIAPNGLTEALRVTANAGTAQHGYQSSATTIPGSTVCTLSIYAKAGTSKYVRIDTSNTSNWSVNAGCSVDLSTGTIITGSGLVQPVGNGWYRISAQATTTAAAGATRGIWAWVSDATGASTTTATGTESILIWGAQIEVGYAPSSHIATTTAAVTRAADTATTAAGSRGAEFYNVAQVTRASDNAVMTGSATSGWLAQGVGTLYAESSKASQPTSSFPRVVSLNDGTHINEILLLWWNAGNKLYYAITTNNVGQTDIGISNLQQSANHKIAAAYGPTACLAAVNGVNCGTDTTNIIPTVTNLNIGSGPYGIDTQLYIKKIMYYPVALTMAELQAITT